MAVRPTKSASQDKNSPTNSYLETTQVHSWEPSEQDHEDCNVIVKYGLLIHFMYVL